MPHLQDQLLHSLSTRQLSAVRRSGNSVVELEVAAWLHLPGHGEQPVSLLVRYHDGERQLDVPVDHGRVDPRQRILLSGVARLPLQAQLENIELRLRCEAIPQSLRIEDIFVQPLTCPVP